MRGWRWLRAGARGKGGVCPWEGQAQRLNDRNGTCHTAEVSHSQSQNRPQLRSKHLSAISLGLARAGERGQRRKRREVGGGGDAKWMTGEARMHQILNARFEG